MLLSGAQLTPSFLHKINDYIAIIHTKIIFKFCAGSYGGCVQVMQPFMKFPYLFAFINYI